MKQGCVGTDEFLETPVIYSKLYFRSASECVVMELFLLLFAGMGCLFGLELRALHIK